MEAIIFCGIQGSGKTTFYRDQFLKTHVRIGLDLLKTRNREDILLHACLAAQQPFVVDNTNPAAAARARYAHLAHAAGFAVHLYHFDCDVALAVARNAQRSGKECVPEVAIRGTANKLETPAATEPFERVFVVSSGPDAFTVRELT